MQREQTFIKETIPVEEVAKRLGRGVATIQAALKKGQFSEFGKAFQSESGDWVYICSRAAFEHWLAYGQTPIRYEIHIREEEFGTLAKVIMASD